MIQQSAVSTFIATDGASCEDSEILEGKLVFIGKGPEILVFKKMFNQHVHSVYADKR